MAVKTIRVLDAKKFISKLEERKKRLRKSYVESEEGGASIFRYMDYASLMYAATNSIIEVSIKDSEFTIHTVPEDVIVEHEFDVEEIDAGGDVIMVGDSRTICMFNKTGDDSMHGKVYDGVKVYAGWGLGYSYLKNVLETAINYTTLVVWLGCNDAAQGLSFEETYGPLYDSLIEEGKEIVLVNVGRTDDRFLAPGDEGYINSNMIRYNEEMAMWAEEREGITFVDAYEASSEWELNKEDGIHYTPRPTTDIWKFIKGSIPEEEAVGAKRKVSNMNVTTKNLILGIDPDIANGEAGNSSSGGSIHAAGSGEKEIIVFDADIFIEKLKERKSKLRSTYVESKKSGAKIFRYIDYASLMYMLESSMISVSITDSEFTVDDVPTDVILEHTFEVEKVEPEEEEE